MTAPAFVFFLTCSFLGKIGELSVDGSNLYGIECMVTRGVIVFYVFRII